MKRFYIAYTAQLDGKNYAGTTSVTGNDNILRIADGGSVTAAHLCSTWKEARELADFWDDCFMRNGTSVFA